jgi:hypothetical protein
VPPTANHAVHHPRLLHGFTISSFPAAPIPDVLGSYKPSAKAGGAWKTPAFVALARYTKVPAFLPISP